MQNNAKPASKKFGSIAVIVLLLLVFGVFRFYKSCKTAREISASNSPTNTTASDGRLQQVIPPDAKLVFTRHAKCRMACRHITEENIREVLREGHVNAEKSQADKVRCPTFAIEDAMSDGTQLRIVFARCPREVKVVTCIDRTHDYTCDCGDE